MFKEGRLKFLSTCNEHFGINPLQIVQFLSWYRNFSLLQISETGCGDNPASYIQWILEAFSLGIKQLGQGVD
jgi:hypothetical protein